MAHPYYGKINKIRHLVPTAKQVIKKIGYQFPDSPEGRLMHSILGQAINDLFVDSQRAKAARHLQGNMWESTACGLDPDWVRLQLKKAGISIEERIQ